MRTDQTVTLRIPVDDGVLSPQLPPWPAEHPKVGRWLAVACLTLAFVGTGAVALSSLFSASSSTPKATSEAATIPAAGVNEAEAPQHPDVDEGAEPLPDALHSSAALNRGAIVQEDVGTEDVAAAALERAAVDALIVGDYSQASAFYRELARHHPTPAFTEAARILAEWNTPERSPTSERRPDLGL